MAVCYSKLLSWILCFGYMFVYCTSWLLPHGMLPLVRPICCTMTWLDYYQYLDFDWLLVIYHHPIMLSLYTQHDILDLWLSSLREPWLVILYHDQWLVFLLYMQWPDYIVLMYFWFLIMSISYFSRNLIILISYNLYGYGRKWWMPEWYLAYSNGIKYWRLVWVGLWAHRRFVWGGLWASNTGPRCMGTTIRSDISSPSASVNNPWLAYIWMYVGWTYTRSHT